MKKMTHAALVGAMSAALAACGGGGGSEGPASGIAGFYEGSLSLTEATPTPPVVAEPVDAVEVKAVAEEAAPDYEGDAFALLLDSGDFFVISDASGRWDTALQGRLTLGTGSTLSSTNIRLFNDGSEDLTVTSASYVEQDSVTASLKSADDASVEISLDEFSGTTPTLAALADIPAWNGESFRSFDSSRAEWSGLTISTSGALSTTGTYSVNEDEDEALEENCTYSGQVTPVKGGYTLRVSFGAGCHWSGQTVDGWMLTQTDGGESALRGIILSADRTQAEIFKLVDNRFR